jgi:hypothetical protein
MFARSHLTFLIFNTLTQLTAHDFIKVTLVVTSRNDKFKDSLAQL